MGLNVLAYVLLSACCCMVTAIQKLIERPKGVKLLSVTAKSFWALLALTLFFATMLVPQASGMAILKDPKGGWALNNGISKQEMEKAKKAQQEATKQAQAREARERAQQVSRTWGTFH